MRRKMLWLFPVFLCTFLGLLWVGIEKEGAFLGALIGTVLGSLFVGLNNRKRG